MSKKDTRFVSIEDEINKSGDPAISEQREYRKKIAYTTQDIVDKLDQQKLRDIELEFMRKATKEELEDSIRKLDNHAICSGNVVCPKDVHVVTVKENKCEGCVKEQPVKQTMSVQPVAVPVEPAELIEEVHGPDCHCSKCCPNPKPSFFQKHKAKILGAIVFVCVLVLSIGWMPSGGNYEALQKAYVELIVNLPKMVMLGIAGFSIYKIAKTADDKNKKKE